MKSSGSPTWPTRILRLADILPLAIPSALASFSVVAMVFLVVGHFQSIYVWGLGGMAALITAFLIAKASQKVNLPGTERERNLCNMLLLAGVSLWVGINIFFTSEANLSMPPTDGGNLRVTKRISIALAITIVPLVVKQCRLD